jgi:hypothetical protein
MFVDMLTYAALGVRRCKYLAATLVGADAGHK